MSYTQRDAAPDLPTDATDSTRRDSGELAQRTNDLSQSTNDLYTQVQSVAAAGFVTYALAAAAAPANTVPHAITELSDVDNGSRNDFYIPVWSRSANKFVFLDFSGVAAGSGAGQVANWPSLPSTPTVSSLAPNVWTRATTLPGAGQEPATYRTTQERVRCIDTDYSSSYHATGGAGTGSWYVSTSGSDATGAGTKTNPYRTLNKAQSVASNGDYVVVRGGRYREQFGTVSGGGSLAANTTIVAYAHEEVLILGSINVTNTASADSGTTIVWTSTANGYRLDLQIAGTVSGGNVFTATSGYPFHAGLVGAKVTGAGTGITISSLKSATNGGANSTRYQAVNLGGTATNGAATITVGLGAALDRTAGTSGTVGYDSALINTSSYNVTAGEPMTVWCETAKQTRVPYSSSTVLTSGQYMYDATNQQLYIGSDPTMCSRIEIAALGKFVGSTASAFVLKLWGVGVGHYGTNINPANGDVAAIYLTGSGCEIVDCTIFHNHGYAVSMRGDNWKIRRSLLIHNGANAVHATNTNGGLLEACRLAYNHNELYERGQGRGSFMVGTFGTVKCAGPTTGATFRLNIVHDNHSNGIWYDRATTGTISQPSTSVDVKMVRNLIMNNDGYGIQNEMTERVIIAGNVICSNAWDGIKYASCPSARTYHNTTHGNGWAGAKPTSPVTYDARKWWTDTVTSFSELVHWCDTRYTGWSNSYTGAATGSGDIKSNVFLSTNPTGQTAAGPDVVATRNQAASPSMSGLTMISSQDSNWYGRLGANLPKNVVEVAVSGTTSPTRYATLALWRSGLGSGRDATSVDANGLASIGDIFTAWTMGDFSIVASSSADVAGAALPSDVVTALNAATDSSYQLALSAGDTPKIGAHTDWLLVPTWM